MAVIRELRHADSFELPAGIMLSAPSPTTSLPVSVPQAVHTPSLQFSDDEDEEEEEVVTGQGTLVDDEEGVLELDEEERGESKAKRARVEPPPSPVAQPGPHDSVPPTVLIDEQEEEEGEEEEEFDAPAIVAGLSETQRVQLFLALLPVIDFSSLNPK